MELQGFLAKVAHDLKAPARQMNSIVELLSSDAGFSEDQLPVVEMLCATAQKGMLQVEGLSYFARSIDVGDSCRVMDFSDELNRAAAKHENLVVNGADKLRFDIDFNPYGLDNILAEILSNTVKYSPDAHTAELTVDVQRLGQSARIISFNSKSVGVEFDHPERLLAPYARDPKPGTVEGYGMGLTVVDYLVCQAGGHLSLSLVDDRFVVDWFLNPQREPLVDKAA